MKRIRTIIEHEITFALIIAGTSYLAYDVVYNWVKNTVQ